MLHNEQQLVRQVKNDDVDAFEILFKEYNQRVYNFIFHFTKNTEETENLVQEVFINVWEMRSKLIEDIPIGKLFYKIAKQRALNYLRKVLNEQLYKNYIVHFQEGSESTTEKDILFKELHSFIRKCINSLPDRRKEIFLSSLDDGLSYKEIAQKLNISENTVDSQIRHALNYIRGQIKLHFQE